MSIRITAGEWGGRFIQSPQGKGTRPTAAITRQALFNILSEKVTGVRMLDLYAGSGIVTAEALSRGAASSLLVDLGKAQGQLLQANFKSLDALSRVQVLLHDIRKFDIQAQAWGQFDLIYADPPFTEEYPDLRPFLQWLTLEGVAVFEMPSRKLPEWASEATTIRRYGESSLAFFYS